jgi:futalosine hydrolase
MKLLIVYATAGEISLPEEAMETVQHGDVKQYNYQHTLEISVLITGAGMIPTTYHLQKELAKNKYDLVINAGLAGSFDKAVSLGTVFLVTEDCFSETGAEDGDEFIPLAQLGLMDPDEHPYTAGHLINKYTAGITAIENLPKARAITVNRVHGNISSIEKVKKLFNARLESMEGAAFFYVCMNEKIPCLQIRAVSNFIEKRNKNAWDIPLALKHLGSEMEKILNELAGKKTI